MGGDDRRDSRDVKKGASDRRRSRDRSRDRDRGKKDADMKRRGDKDKDVRRGESKDSRSDRDKDRRISSSGTRDRSDRDRSERDRSERDRSERDRSERDRGGSKDNKEARRSESDGKDKSSSRRRSRSRSPVRIEESKSGANHVEERKAPSTAEAKVPLSLEDLIMKQKEKEVLSKPVFLTRGQRAEIALAKRQEEIKQKRAKEQELKQAHLDLLAKARDEYADVTGRGGGRDNGRGDYRGDRDYRSHDTRDDFRDRGRSGRSDRHGRESDRKGDDSEKGIRDLAASFGMSKEELEAEQKAIKERYVGKEKQKRRVRRMNEKKFTFDWDDGDDTGVDHNSLYKERHQVHAMFGRGHFGGIDIRQQRKEADHFYSDFLEKRRTEDENEKEVERVKTAEGKIARKKHDDRHWSDKPLDQMAERDWRIFREDFNITTRGGKIPHPYRSWDESPLPDNIKDVIASIGYKEPSPIQRQALPIGLQNRDIVGIAETGSGKTAAFLIPMLVWISHLPPRVINPEDSFESAPYAIILAPTRELAQQIEEECQKFAVPLKVRAVSIIGGLTREEQGFMLRNGCDIVVATPGRLKDMLENRYLVLTQCTYVVMDEADRMIDMGFETDVQAILDFMPVTNKKPEDDENDEKSIGNFELGNIKKFRQTVMFTATMPPAVERMSRQYLRKPAHVYVGTAGKAVDRVEQRVELMSDSNKRKRLGDLLQNEGIPAPIIIFVNQKKGCDVLAKGLDKLGFRSVTLHGGKSQDQRQLALQDLKEGNADILVATDVAGRGLDVKDVGAVINYDMAKNIEDYTHRIGRTGRAGKTGVAITFLTPEDKDTYYDLKQMLTLSSVSKCPPTLSAHPDAQHKPGTVLNKRKKEETLFVK
eukprot:CFRG1323T1